MNEIINTSRNQILGTQAHFWGWEIPVYLFLGGIVAGMMIISGFFILTGRTKNARCSCFLIPVISLAAISIGMFALFLDLEHKLYFWRLYVTFQWKSPMSWGAWILILVYPILAANALIGLPNEIADKFRFLSSLSEKIRAHLFSIKLIGAMSMIVGGVLGMYTGILLSTFNARPLWNSSMLWILFLVSGLSAAAAFVHLFAREDDERRLLAKADNAFLIAEFMIILLMFIGFASSGSAQSEALNLFFGGSFTASFWVFVILMGIILPFIIQIMAVNHKVQHTPIAPIMVMLGGLILRFIIVEAGQQSHLVNTFFNLP